MKSILEYIQEKLNIIEPSIPIVEMATIDKTVKVSTNTYRIALHGPAVGDRPCPHFHIYLANDVYPYKRFNIEISLIDLLCYDELNIVAIQDKEKKINIKTRVRDNILKSKEQKTIQPIKGGHKMVTYQNYVSLFYCQITSCPSDGGIS